MATSTQDITSSSTLENEAEIHVAASILMQLNHDYLQKQSSKGYVIGDEVASTPLLQVRQAHPSMKRKRADKTQDENSKGEKEDDSEQTLRHMLYYQDNTPEYPPEKIFIHDPDAMGDCSKPIRKQLTGSDVKKDQCRLMLGKKQVKKMMLDVLGETMKLGTEGIKVSVYGPDGEIYELEFKKWKVNSVLTSPEWKKFVTTYNLNKYCNFLTIWMFKHKRTRQICFAIDSTRFPVYKKLSNRIKKAAAFKNPN
ncbi:putative B3 domain-containing protein [Cardamine amara subsp. amara]|uniref:B3 domain-containing protein n=1 Tax=Cardamine amara subsp. amara TaxID=228776 RepID=A0ABD1BKW7_CARAN